MPRLEFEPVTPACQRTKTVLAVDVGATVTDRFVIIGYQQMAEYSSDGSGITDLERFILKSRSPSLWETLVVFGRRQDCTKSGKISPSLTCHSVGRHGIRCMPFVVRG
jgi:hypothetical protein